MAKPGRNMKVVVSKNGPYIVTGGLSLGKEIIAVDENQDPLEWKRGDSYPLQECYSLCRCGNSNGKPYCDNSHVKAGFDGTETAERKDYSEQAEVYTGPGLILNDAQELCATARFCHRKGGAWSLTEKSDRPECRKAAIEESCDCPSGRLVAADRKSKNPIEPVLERSITLVEDPGAGVSGPIRLKGGVPLESSDGNRYEVRNRVTLCRCGKSKNKPYCDGTHIKVGFNDGDKNLKKD